MLGMRQSSEPAKGQVARDIRMQMWRIASGHQNEFDHKMAHVRKESNNGNRYEVVWEN